MKKPPRFQTKRKKQQETHATSGADAGFFKLSGRRPVLEALRQGLAESLEISPTAHGDTIREIRRLAEKSGIPVAFREVESGETEESTQGVRAVVRLPELKRSLLKFVRALPKQPPPLLVMLDGISDPHNFGAILRSACAAGADAVIVRIRRQAPLTDAVVKSSAGAALSVPIFPVNNLSRTLQQLVDEGFWSVAAVLDPEAVNCWDFNWNSPLILILGAEGKGVSHLLRERADHLVKIPMYGPVDSLNAAVAAGLLLFISAHQRKQKSE